MLTLPIRTCSRFDLQGALTSWLDSAGAKTDIAVTEVMDDLQRLDALRAQLSSDATAVQVLHEYHACLVECQNKKFPPDDCAVRLEWTGAFHGDSQVHSALSSERASVLWNVAAVESRSASMASLTDKRALSKAVQQWQLAASLMRHVTLLVADRSVPGMDMSPHMLLFWEKVLLAQGQMCGYYMAGAGGKPKHLLLAKLATAAVPLLTEAAEACRALNGSFDTRSYMLYVRGWSLLMAAKAEHHESVTHSAKSHWGMELARLEKALTLAQACQELVDASIGIPLPLHLVKSLDELMTVLTERYQQAQRDNDAIHREAIPPPQEVREIRGELLAKGTQPLPAGLMTLKTPMFTNILGDMARAACEAFRRDMDALIEQMSQLIESKTDTARKQLASVNLPHSLTAYKQEQSGGGIPLDLWGRVDAIQQSRRMSQLKTQLWELRDVAEQARSIYKRTYSQLEEDLQMDQLFREQHSGFEGHDVHVVQNPYRGSLQNYEKLLNKSQEGDLVLLRRLEILDTDPKYKLLQFQKSQLDRLLPGSSGEPLIDTSYLSRLLVELSAQLNDREVLLNLLKTEVKSYNIRAKVADIDQNSQTAEQEYHQAVIMAQRSFSGIVCDIQLNVDHQMELMETILQENAQFMATRDAGPSSVNADSCIVMIEDAIEEIEQLSKHLKEGNDFYKVVIPKLEQVQQQVGDASVRLTVERYDYEDSHHNSASRRQQELDDARMAASLAGDPSTVTQRVVPHPQENPNTDIAPDVLPSSAASRPGVVNVSHNEPRVRVDDEKVASLVAMDFDPDKVVAALKKYDNNVEQALNELLSC
jgi:hypothetical protein